MKGGRCPLPSFHPSVSLFFHLLAKAVDVEDRGFRVDGFRVDNLAPPGKAIDEF